MVRLPGTDRAEGGGREVVHVGDLPTARVLLALFAAARQIAPGPTTLGGREAELLLAAHGPHFGDLHGRRLNLDLSSRSLDVTAYNLANGLGAGQAAVATVRATMPMDAEIWSALRTQMNDRRAHFDDVTTIVSDAIRWGQSQRRPGIPSASD